eukprot:519865-Karenia_brevis.AAC.1
MEKTGSMHRQKRVGLQLSFIGEIEPENSKQSLFIVSYPQDVLRNGQTWVMISNWLSQMV